jgi:hypothetical protein
VRVDKARHDIVAQCVCGACGQPKLDLSRTHIHIRCCGVAATRDDGLRRFIFTHS